MGTSSLRSLALLLPLTLLGLTGLREGDSNRLLSWPSGLDFKPDVLGDYLLGRALRKWHYASLMFLSSSFFLAARRISTPFWRDSDLEDIVFEPTLA